MTSDKPSLRLSQLLDMSVVQRLAEANYNATGMPIGIIDAFDGSILVGCGWQDICVHFHREHPRSLERCRESDDYIKRHLSTGAACEYTCRNGLRDIGVPIVVAGEHLATLFLGQFFYADEPTNRRVLRPAGGGARVRRARVPRRARARPGPRVAARSRTSVAYDRALVRFIGELAEGALRHARDQKALRESEERFRMLADNMAQLAWIADERGRMRWFNKRWFDYTGPAAHRAQWHRVELRPPRSPGARRREDPALLRDRRAVGGHVPDQGEGRLLSLVPVALAPIRDAAGKVIRWFGTNTDVTEQRQAEEALREADRRKDEFLGVLSHELRNPLAPIRNSHLHPRARATPGSEQAPRARGPSSSARPSTSRGSWTTCST